MDNCCLISHTIVALNEGWGVRGVWGEVVLLKTRLQHPLEWAGTLVLTQHSTLTSGSKKAVRDNSGHTPVNRLCWRDKRSEGPVHPKSPVGRPSSFSLGRQAVGLGEGPPINVHSRSLICRITWCPSAAVCTTFFFMMETAKSPSQYDARLGDSPEREAPTFCNGMQKTLKTRRLL